jgi:hypothetical protein
MVPAIAGNNLVCDLQVTFVPEFFTVTTDKLFDARRHEEFLPFQVVVI